MGLHPAREESGGGNSAEATGQSWRVSRRFSQFVELHQGLWARHAAEIQRCGAQLPSKFRLPSSLEVEGDQRAPTLDEYLRRLISSRELRRSEMLTFFLAANKPARRELWYKAVHSEF